MCDSEVSTNFLCPENLIPSPTLVMYGSMHFISTLFLTKMPSVCVACDAHPHALISSTYAHELASCIPEGRFTSIHKPTVACRRSSDFEDGSYTTKYCACDDLCC